MYKILLALLLILTSSNCFSYESENKLTAVIIGKLAKYISWDSASASDAFIITILNNPFDKLLDEIYKDKKIKKKNVKFKYISNIDELEETRILYIPDISYKELQNIHNKVKNKNILTIGSSKGFTEKGGHSPDLFCITKTQVKNQRRISKSRTS